MARSSDIRIFIAKKFPTLPMGLIYVELHSLITTMESAKDAEGYKPEYGTTFQNEWVKDTVHIKPGNKVAFVSSKVSFTEKSIYQFLEELSVIRHIDMTGDMTFLDMYGVVPLDDVKDIMSPAEVAGLNAEVYATLMKRWYNRHRDGASNATIIQRRLRNVDAHIEVMLDKFVFHQDQRKMSFDVKYVGKTEPHIFLVPDYAFDIKDTSSKKFRLYHRDVEKYVTAGNINFGDAVTKISEFTGGENKHIAHALQAIIGEVIGCVASGNTDIFVVEGYHHDYTIKAAWVSTPHKTTITFSVRPRKPADPTHVGINITSELNQLIVSMNKYAGEFEQAHVSYVGGLLDVATNGAFLSQYANKLPPVLSDYTAEVVQPSDLTEHLVITPAVKKIHDPRRYNLRFVTQGTRKLIPR
ncbi:hypothetical protein OBP_163 [Pseudomonas phage OBP]|uniref:hypothetical protein n=1 Tax=Pseudomonas phage OBP TaxID=1124849 RepID=UPI000240D583|nr:hypothetical protein OBP_163 [Pseudomonas phage OBP]AEV89600.1 hypothetical protein OBP_163 [Pseudomonas phage OBP]